MSGQEPQVSFKRFSESTTADWELIQAQPVGVGPGEFLRRGLSQTRQGSRPGSPEKARVYSSVMAHPGLPTDPRP
jgi:hypothetical protein